MTEPTPPAEPPDRGPCPVDVATAQAMADRWDALVSAALEPLDGGDQA